MKIDGFSPGTPCWIDLSTPDPEASSAFYSGLFGWDIEVGGPEVGSYRMCLADGDAVAGIAGIGTVDAPSSWRPYLSVVDADQTMDQASRSGGSALADPMDVSDLGRMAVISDPTGAAIGIWQPRGFHGASRVGEPNAYIWSELITGDVRASVAFYDAVFGLHEMGERIGDTEACQLGAGEHPIVGILAKPDAESDTQDRWEIYFVVRSLEDTCVQALSLGGQVHDGPIGLPIGRIAHLSDSTGAAFGILQPQHA